MTDLGISIKKCIGSSADGASNMRGQYNGFNAWMEKKASSRLVLCSRFKFGND